MVVEPLVVALLLAAALMHATWNALLKADRSDRLATFGVIMTTGTVMGLIAVPFLPQIAFGAWKYLAISVIVHVAYYTFLLQAYSYGDLSHTYPIARGHGAVAGRDGVGAVHRRAPAGAGHRRRGAAERRPGDARHSAEVGDPEAAARAMAWRRCSPC